MFKAYRKLNPEQEQTFISQGNGMVTGVLVVVILR